MLRSSIARGLSEEHLRRSPLPRPSRSLLEADGLPTYDPHSDIGKKVAAWTNFSENAIHFIPAIVVLCAALLWFFSDPGEFVNACLVQPLLTTSSEQKESSSDQM